MLSVAPVWSTPFLIIYFTVSFAALVLCLVTCVAIFRTKRTPYPSKLLLTGLLCYDCMFLIFASIAKLFPHEESFPLRHLARGFQTAAQIIVTFMAFERYFVLNWPYVYLKAPKRRIRQVCLCAIVLSFLQFVIIKGLGCGGRGLYQQCYRVGSIYFPVMCLILLVASFAAFIKIYTIIRRKAFALKEYRGTIASFLYLVNCAGFIGLYFGLSLTFLRANSESHTGEIAHTADVAYILNCVFDSLIYGLWFKEVRLEILKIVSVVCSCVRPNVDRMRVEVFAMSYDLTDSTSMKTKHEFTASGYTSTN